MPPADKAGFLAKVSEASEALKSAAEDESLLFLMSHFDADGLAAASIASKALLRLDAVFQLRAVDQVNDEVVNEAFHQDADVYVFVEIGSGYLGVIERNLPDKTCIVIDHHPPSREAPSRLLHVNPHLFGIDGAKELSGAGAAYLVAKGIDVKNMDLSPLAVVGALGDSQDQGEKFSFLGLNQEIVHDATNIGHLEVKTDLLFYGRETRPIHKSIAHTTNPFLPGISAEEDQCLSLLKSCGIPLKEDEKWRTIADLTNEEKQSLLSRIIESVTRRGVKGEVALRLIGNVYILSNEEKATPTRDAREYASLLNACGRMNKQSIAIAIGLGERATTLEQAQSVVSDYRRNLARYMSWLSKNVDRRQPFERLDVVRAEGAIEERMTGVFSSILLSSGLAERGKAVVVVAETKDSMVKLSARIPDELLRVGVNLGDSMQSLAGQFHGAGGGHGAAAGARISRTDLDEFLLELDRKTSDQLEAGTH